MRNRPTLFRADQSRAAGSSQPISHPHWFGFLGESRMGTVTQIRDLDSTSSRAQADCALLRLAAVRRLKLNTTFVMDDRRT